MGRTREGRPRKWTPTQHDRLGRHKSRLVGLGVIGHIALGIVGALIGGFIAGINATTIVVAVIGAVIAVVGYNAIRGRSRAGRGPI